MRRRGWLLVVTVLVWAVVGAAQNAELLIILSGHTENVQSSAFSPDRETPDAGSYKAIKLGEQGELHKGGVVP